MMPEPHKPGRDYGSGETFILEGPPVIFDHKRWSSSFTVDEEAAAAKGWRRGEHGWVKDMSDASGRLRWVLSMESSETGVQNGQFRQSWDGYEGDQVRLRIQAYADGRIVVYPFKRDESETETVWEVPAACAHESEVDDSRIDSAYYEYICVACGRIRQGEHK